MTGLLEAVLGLAVAAAWDAWRRHVASRERRDEITLKHELDAKLRLDELQREFEAKVSDLDKTVQEKSGKLDEWRSEIMRDIKRNSEAKPKLLGSRR